MFGYDVSFKRSFKNLHDIRIPERQKRRHASTEALWVAPGNCPEHVEHDRRGPVHYDSTLNVGPRWSPGHVGLDCSCPDRDSRWNGLERARRGNAGIGRFVSVPARGLRPGNLRPTPGFSVYLAVHSERAIGNSVGLHRLRSIYRLHLARYDAANDMVDGWRGWCHQYRAAVSPHHVDWHDYRQSMDWDF